MNFSASGTRLLRPQPLNAPKRLVGEFAEKVAQEVGYKAGGSIHELVARLNGRVRYDDRVLRDDESPESIVVLPDGKFEVVLPTVSSSGRDRFTVAHELGHYFLHFPKINSEHAEYGMSATRKVDHGDPEQMRAEWEANWFAASFVMPRQEFQDAIRNGIAFAANHFGVSRQAVEIRNKTLHDFL